MGEGTLFAEWGDSLSGVADAVAEVLELEEDVIDEWSATRLRSVYRCCKYNAAIIAGGHELDGLLVTPGSESDDLPLFGQGRAHLCLPRRHVLERAGITTIGQLRAAVESGSLLGVHGIGPKTFAEIESELRAFDRQ